jgi:hypothetical protein
MYRAFYAPERDNLPYYVMEHNASKSDACMNTPHGYPKTLFDKIWDSHVVAQEPGSPAVLYIDLTSGA